MGPASCSTELTASGAGGGLRVVDPGLAAPVPDLRFGGLVWSVAAAGIPAVVAAWGGVGLLVPGFGVFLDLCPPAWPWWTSGRSASVD